MRIIQNHFWWESEWITVPLFSQRKNWKLTTIITYSSSVLPYNGILNTHQTIIMMCVYVFARYWPQYSIIPFNYFPNGTKNICLYTFDASLIVKFHMNHTLISSPRFECYANVRGTCFTQRIHFYHVWLSIEFVASWTICTHTHTDMNFFDCHIEGFQCCLTLWAFNSLCLLSKRRTFGMKSPANGFITCHNEFIVR